MYFYKERTIRKRITFLLLIFSCLILQNFFGYKEIQAAIGNKFISEKKHVLILNSYHSGLPWTDEQTQGIIDSLIESYPDATISIEYMDWIRYNNEKNMKNIYNSMHDKYANKEINVVVATDEDALEFVLSNREKIFFNAPVVFSGISEESRIKLTTNIKNITGVIEEADVENTIKMALEVNPKLENIYLIYDDTESGKVMGREASRVIDTLNNKIEVTHLNSNTYDSLIENVRGIPENSAVIISTYYKDKDGVNLELEEITKLVCENTDKPVFNLYDFTIGSGVIGGSMLSGKLQGEEAGKLAARILNGEKADTIDIVRSNTYRNIYDFNQLKKFKIPVKSIAINSEIINRPFSFIEHYKGFVYSIAGTFIFLVVFISILIFYIRKQKILEKKLRDNNVELSLTYAELSASEAELKSNIKELNNIHSQLDDRKEELSFMAYHDPLTGILNRQALQENFGLFMSESKDNLGAFMIVDFDNFKYVNDSMGHAFGDEFIKAVAGKFGAALTENSRVYRIGGDEFVILISNSNQEQIMSQAKKIVALFREPVQVDSNKIKTTISMGISIYPEHGDNLEEILKKADIALYRAKAEGKNRYVLYKKEFDTKITERAEVEKQLQSALEREEFVLYYQPQVSTKTGKICGFEALIRWDNPSLGMVSPLKFIKIAEENQLIIPIGHWVIREACKFVKDLKGRGYSDMVVSINISFIQLIQEGFLDELLNTIKEFSIPYSSIELEITESVFMENIGVVKGKLIKLRKLGIKIALDDFGTGYSSLSYLQKLPITTLKIDRSFIKDVDNTKLAETIIVMGHQMNLEVVAEGIEYVEQLEDMKNFKCDKIQGYIYSKPVPSDEAVNLLL